MTPSLPPLREFLEQPARPADTLTYHALQGFLFTVASAPELVLPSEWLPVIFADNDPGYGSIEEAQHVFDQVMALYNDINSTVLEEHPALPGDCLVFPDPLENLEPSAPLSRWSRGFMIGHRWLEELWEIDMPADLDDEVGAVLMTLSFFASRELAEAFHREELGGEPLEELASRLLRLLPEAIVQYAFIGRTVLAEAYAGAEQPPEEPRRVVKVGRNDPCPCGSGKKFKKCCGSST